MKHAVARTFLLEALCLAVLTGAVQAQDSRRPGEDSPPRERSVKILTDVPDGVPPPPQMSAADLASINVNMKTDNAAGLALDIVPSGEVIAGSRIGFRLTTKKPGYLILLNIDAAGKLTQIFPEAPTETGPVREAPSMIKPGKPLIIPELGSPYATFEFIAEPPAGVAMVVGLLSDKPVQLVDLPNAPPPAFAPEATLKYVREQTLALVVPNRNSGQLERPNWSFDGKLYLVK
jgi:Domain of unknown function (DUF4384)